MGISKMTKEHLGVSLALEIPVMVIVTKVDMCPENVLRNTVRDLLTICAVLLAKKIPVIVRNQENIDFCLSQKLERACPVFLVSSVKGLLMFLVSSPYALPRLGLVQGTNIELLRNFLSRLDQGKRLWDQINSLAVGLYILNFRLMKCSVFVSFSCSCAIFADSFPCCFWVGSRCRACCLGCGLRWGIACQ